MKIFRHISTFIFISISSFHLFGQATSSSFSIFNGEFTNTQLSSKGTFQSKGHSSHIYLDDPSDLQSGNTMKKLLKIKIPSGTKYWYYCFSTNSGEDIKRSLNVSTKLDDRLIKAEMDKTEPELTSFQIPEGTDRVNIYLLDIANSALFCNETVDSGSKLAFIYEGTVLNRKQGLVRVQNNSDTSLVLGVIKSEKSGGVNVDFDFVFIIDSSHIDLSKDKNSFKNDFFNNNFSGNSFFNSSMAINMGNQGWSAFQQGYYDECLRLSKRALELDNSLGWVHFNIALVYLVQGHNHKALKKYNEATDVTLKEISIKHDMEGAIDDLKTYMHLFSSKKVAYKILNRLTSVAEKYLRQSF
jgi:tetratricopeptide (TPR) repeat protein